MKREDSAPGLEDVLQALIGILDNVDPSESCIITHALARYYKERNDVGKTRKAMADSVEGSLVRLTEITDVINNGSKLSHFREGGER